MTTANEAAIRQWGAMPRADIEAYDDEGDFGKRHLLNPVLLGMLGDVAGRRVLDAGCGQGYLSRLLADRGATVVGLEPARALIDYAIELETHRRQGVHYIEADLCQLPDLSGPFDAVVASMVLPAIPDWRGAMRSCVQALAPGGTFVFSVNHPCFEQLRTSWREHGEYRTRRYLRDYEIPGRHATDFHRPCSDYLNEVIGLGCQLRAIAEPGLDPAVAERADVDGLEAYVHLPNFLVVAAERPPAPGTDERQDSRSVATARSTAATLRASPRSGYRPRRRPVETPSSSLMTSSTITVMSSGFFRVAATTDGSGSSTRTDNACSPRRPSATPNSTRWPGFSSVTPPGSASRCTNTSAPSSRDRKPKPFSALNHLTLPLGTVVHSACRDRNGPAPTDPGEVARTG